MCKVIDEIGNVYGRLTVIEEAGKDKQRKTMWKCLCVCGVIKKIRGYDLRSGHTSSCGCLNIEKIIKRNKQGHSKETRMKISMSLRGIENIEEWGGFITPKQKKIRNSSKYAQWRLSVYERDNFTCQICKERGGSLVAHHIGTFATNESLIFKVWNGLTLCKDCHEPLRGHEAKHQAEFLNYNLQGFFKEIN